ncbi:MAG TPA: MerR family transcriptional regulator [Frankiaceae bacterium]|jgi:DNA-binding transcriptional MerR regulator|nr:MerR family transcriptional regulator [Frankiaceae bacterium]
MADADIQPIHTVARLLGLRASAIRYYEERGLVEPALRLAGRRWYSPEQVRRLAIIQYWQAYGLMSLEEIADVLAGPKATRGWAEIIEQRITALDEQLREIAGARDHLRHVLSHHENSAPDGCEHYEARLFNGLQARNRTP